ncbi:MAG TPA: acyltransferase domain-containing protein [Sphaerochaeta sp.]|nr:acyltransferase domain-containing protein [Sphaerochaeta sp.]
MWIAFKNDTALTDSQIDLIRTRYNQVRDVPLHLSLVASSIALLEKQENKSLFLLFDQGFKEFGPLYSLVLIYALYPKVVSLYSRLGISDQVRQATLSDIAIWVRTYENQHSGSTGLDRYGWICRHLCAKVLRLGRLQFEQSFFRFPHFIYYDTALVRYRAFAQEGLLCTADGYLDVSSGSESGSWSTTYSRTNDLLIAHEVDQSLGRISPVAVSVSLSDLTLICTQNTPILSVHIPEGQALTPSLVDASFSAAQAMFSPTLFVCDSWLLDPELMEVLPSESNICHFMQRFLKFPIAFTTAQIYERVFGFNATHSDIVTWECTTNLQKKVKAHILGGGIFRTMGGYIPNP